MNVKLFASPFQCELGTQTESSRFLFLRFVVLRKSQACSTKVPRNRTTFEITVLHVQWEIQKLVSRRISTINHHVNHASVPPHDFIIKKRFFRTNRNKNIHRKLTIREERISHWRHTNKQTVTSNNSTTSLASTYTCLLLKVRRSPYSRWSLQQSFLLSMDLFAYPVVLVSVVLFFLENDSGSSGSFCVRCSKFKRSSVTWSQRDRAALRRRFRGIYHVL